MAIEAMHLIGEWRQVSPQTGSDEILITFEADGRLTYTVDGETTQHVLLTWKVVGNTIVSNQPSARREDVTVFRFESPSRLLLERPDERYVYERC